MENILSSTSVEGYEISCLIGKYTVHSLVIYKPVQGNLCESMVELYIGLDSLSAPMKFTICGVQNLKTAFQKEEFACSIVESHATILLPYLIRWKDCIDSLEKKDVQKAMKLNGILEYTEDTAFELLKANYPKMKFGGMLGRFEK